MLVVPYLAPLAQPLPPVVKLLGVGLAQQPAEASTAAFVQVTVTAAASTGTVVSGPRAVTITQTLKGN
jgi:hypothetical protein